MSLAATMTQADPALLNRICERALAQMNRMIWDANNRKSKRKGDPKTGGHPASCSSSLQILGALHLAVREPEDYVCCKPHAAPMDHALHHLLGLMRHGPDDWFSSKDSKAVMTRLRKFSEAGEPVFQSYHAATDGDHFHFLPSGTVGIPPVNSIFLALAHRYALDHGMPVPETPHFWSLIGDSEFREGSLFEAMPEASERLLGNVTWIIDYNRQSLDGARTPNNEGLLRDCDRIARTSEANGWKVIHLQHGPYREELFAKPGGQDFKRLLEEQLSDYEFQLALYKKDPKYVRELIQGRSKKAASFAKKLKDADLMRAMGDVAGHDMGMMLAALREAKEDSKVPCMLIVHTIKGIGMDCSANPANHSILPKKQEVTQLLEAAGLSEELPYELFDESSEEGAYLAKRRDLFRSRMAEIEGERNLQAAKLDEALAAAGGLPDALGVDMSLYPEAHTQWMWGQVAAKLARIATSRSGGPNVGAAAKELTPDEERWAAVAGSIVTMSPDVGTSTQIAPVLDGRVYGPAPHNALSESDFNARHPELMTRSDAWTQHIRFEIAEANAMSAAGSFGMMDKYTGHPILPIMTIYDFFVKRALDQLYYNAYWRAGFIMMGTPSGVSLSAEGAQHSWKSDIQMPNLITWEPLFAREMEWVLADAIARHMTRQNEGRSAVYVRGTTVGLQQSLLLDNLRRSARFKAELPAGTKLKPAGAGADWGGAQDEAALAPLTDEEILGALREDCLKGGYYLIDWRGYEGYEPGDNVVQIFTMGAPSTGAIEAAELLLERGIFANVIVVSSPDLLLGLHAHENDYAHLKQGLAISGDLHAVAGAGDSQGGLVSLAGRRVPVVAVFDGEPGILDNIGSIVGVKQATLAVRRFSKCGRPDQVFAYHNLHAEGIVEAAGKVLSETALEDLRVSPDLLARLAAGQAQAAKRDWRELWPKSPSA